MSSSIATGAPLLGIRALTSGAHRGRRFVVVNPQPRRTGVRRSVRYRALSRSHVSKRWRSASCALNGSAAMESRPARGTGHICGAASRAGFKTSVWGIVGRREGAHARPSPGDLSAVADSSRLPPRCRRNRKFAGAPDASRARRTTTRCWRMGRPGSIACRDRARAHESSFIISRMSSSNIPSCSHISGRENQPL